MTIKEQRDALAELCEANGLFTRYKDNQGSLYHTENSNFTHNLDAIHKAENTLIKTVLESYSYGSCLASVLLSSKVNKETYRANAKERTEALLRFKGKWKRK